VPLLKLPSFFSPYIRVDCPDGPRYILKKPEKAFTIVAGDWEIRIKTLSMFFGEVEKNMNLDIAKRFRAIVENLGRNYAELQAHYQATYLQFAGKPCDKKAYKIYVLANEEIRGKEIKLREIEIKAEKVMKLIRQDRTRNIKREFRGSRTFNLDAVKATVGDIEILISELHQC
jgi:cytidylate kinase